MIAWDHGSDSELVDVDGRRYVDFTSGVLVANTGHCHPKVVEAVAGQAARLLNCFSAPHRLALEYADRLRETLPDELQGVYLLTTGAEAIEAALKIARRQTGRPDILGFRRGFHGRTYMAMSAGGLGFVRDGNGPLVPSVLHAPFPYPYRCPLATAGAQHDCVEHTLAAVEDVIETESTGGLAAVILEPYQGSAGSLEAPPGFIRGLRALCDRVGALLVVDEVQAGFGRTGTLFAFEQWDVLPDIVVLGKGIASGVPMSAVVVRNELVDPGLSPHLSSTYGGNPLSCAAALATLEVILEEDLPARAATLGERARRELRRAAGDIPAIGDVRGPGLAIGLELVEDRESKAPARDLAASAAATAVSRGLALFPPLGPNGNVIRIGPALTISEKLLDEGLAILLGVLAEPQAELPERDDPNPWFSLPMTME